MPKVCLITVCFNDLSRLPGFVDSLAHLNYDNFEHVLVDNNSQDGSVEFLRKFRPSIHILEPRTNLATTLGYNLAVQKALEFKPDYILYSAIDVVLDPDCLTRQVELMERDPKIGIVGPVLFLHDEPGVVQSFGFKTQPETMSAESIYSGPLKQLDLPDVIEADYVDGGTALIRRSLMEQLQGMDDRLCIYYEDWDLCYRARQLGYKVMATSGARVYHRYYEKRIEGPPAYQVFYTSRNRIYLARKYNGFSAGWRVFTHWLLPRGVKSSNLSRTIRRGGNPRTILAYYLGALYGILGIMGKRLFLE